MLTLICRNCKAPKTIAKSCFAGDQMRLSGYVPVTKTDATFVWFCPSCVEDLRPHIKAIVEAAGEDVYWGSLVSFLKPKSEKGSDS